MTANTDQPEEKCRFSNNSYLKRICAEKVSLRLKIRDVECVGAKETGIGCCEGINQTDLNIMGHLAFRLDWKIIMNAEDQADYVKPGQTIISSSGRSIEFGQKIGAGAFGQVFAGRIQKENGEQGEVLACKMVPYEPGEESEAEEEINILKMLINVKNIVSLEEAFDVHFDDQHYKIMCFEKLGPSLAHMLQNRKICVPNALKVGLIVLDVFAELEKIGVLYQDLHPGNLLFSHNLSHLKVTDFGNSEVAKRNKKPRKDGKNFLYIFDAISVGFLVLCCRGATTMIRPTATISSYVNSLKHVKETLLEHDSLFLSAFLDEGIEQLRSELSYSKLRKALTSSVYTFNPKEPFIVTQGVPPMLT